MKSFMQRYFCCFPFNKSKDICPLKRGINKSEYSLHSNSEDNSYDYTMDSEIQLFLEEYL